jgi:hypothetical protein
MGRIAKVKVEKFAEAVSKILQEYGNNVTEGTKRAVLAVAKIAKAETKAGSPRKSGGYGTRIKNRKPGHYRQGWAVREDVLDRFRTDAIVHNRTDYQLTHLLERGHNVTRSKGGPVLGRTNARPHVEPAREHAIKNLQEAVKKIAETG